MSEPAARPEGFGRYLSQQRELRGLSLQTVADHTKLSVAMLKALEADDFSHLPERVFVVGAVRAYARAVGLSVEETVLRLHEAMGPQEPEPAVRKRARGRRELFFGAAVAAMGLAGIVVWLVHRH